MSYVATDIKVLTGLEAIRKRPFMYIGPLDGPMLPTRLLQEALCVACDKVGEVTKLAVNLGTITAQVSFDASFPVTLNERSGKRMAEVLLTELFACRAIKGEGSRQLCTIGLVAVVALSSEFHFETCSDGFVWSQSFERGVALTPFAQGEATAEKRTTITFALDESIFGENRRFDAGALRAWLGEVFADGVYRVDDYGA